MASNERVWSDLAVPPGEGLAREIQARGMTQQELAVRMGRPLKTINEIINAKKSITQETALELDRVLGVPAHIWTGLEATYQMTLARNRERTFLESQERWLKEFPVREIERPWLD
jgi:addiction module HigA family antidote